MESACANRGFGRQCCPRLSVFLKKHDVASLVGGDIIIHFTPFLLDVAGNEGRNTSDLSDNDTARSLGGGVELESVYGHISTCCLKPFRPVLLEVRSFVPRTVDEKPTLHNIYEWVSHKMDPSLAWDLASLQLSRRQVGIAHLGSGEVTAMVTAIQPQRIWRGSASESQTRRRAPAHERLLGQRGEGRHEAAGSGEPAEADEAQDEDQNWDNMFHDEDELAEDLFTALETVAFQIEEPSLAEPDQHNPARPVQPSTASSSTSSSSDSSSSDSDVLVEVTPPTAADTQPRPLEQRQSANQVTRVVQRGTHSWVAFRLTYRPGCSGKKPQWQATCRYHSDYSSEGRIQTSCTRSRKLESDDPGSECSQAVLRELKAWLLEGKVCQTRLRTRELLSRVRCRMRIWRNH